MQTILCIDASVDPVRVALVELGPQGGKLLQLQQASCGPGLYKSSFEQLAQANSAPAPEAQGQDASASSAAPTDSDTSEAALRAAISSGLAEAIAQFTTSWDAVVLLIPPVEYLSLNVDLPFADSRSIARVINAELQDLLPFELKDLFVEYRAVGTLPGQANAKHDVHVSLVPRAYLERILTACRGAGVEPEIVTTPAGALSALGQQDTQQLSENCLFIMQHGNYLYLAIKAGDQLRQDRVLDLAALQSGAAITGQVLATIAAAESRYRVKISDCYTLGMVPFTEELRSRLEPTLSALSDAESPEDPSDRKARLCVLAAGLLHQEQPVRLLSNLRSGEFGYNAYLKEVLLAGRALGPLLMLTLLVCLLGIAGSYALREYQIGRLESAVRAKVTEVLQDDSISPGDELNRLQAEITAVQAQLNAMGSQAGISALDVLIELHKDLAGGAVNFRKVSIRDSRIELLGRAPRLSNIEEIETTLNQKRIGPEAARMYCRVKPVKQTSVGTPGAPAYDFQLDLRLCE